MNKDIIDLYDEYTHAPLDRRVFLARLAQLVGGTAATLALVPMLEANQVRAALVSSNDPRLETARIATAGTGSDQRKSLRGKMDWSQLGLDSCLGFAFCV